MDREKKTIYVFIHLWTIERKQPEKREKKVMNRTERLIRLWSDDVIASIQFSVSDHNWSMFPFTVSVSICRIDCPVYFPIPSFKSHRQLTDFQWSEEKLMLLMIPAGDLHSNWVFPFCLCFLLIDSTNVLTSFVNHLLWNAKVTISSDNN